MYEPSQEQKAHTLFLELYNDNAAIASHLGFVQTQLFREINNGYNTAIRLRICSASASEIGVGLSRPPKKPVTLADLHPDARTAATNNSPQVSRLALCHPNASVPCSPSRLCV